jgi:Rrf2 family protein
MRVTNIAEYGMICALHLARRGGALVSGREIAAAERLPADSVEQILIRLRRAGIAQSARGAHGGYRLARPAAEISVRDVIQAAEESVFELNCESHPVDASRCAPSHACSIRPVWLLLQTRINDVLAGVALADLLALESDLGRPSSAADALTSLTRRLPVLAG